MAKVQLSNPTLFLLFGFPGAGKTYFARQLCQDLQAAHVQSDRIRFELFDQPRYDQQEDVIVAHLMKYMAEEFMHAGVSVVFDVNAMKATQRRELREMARHSKAQTVTIWFQLDIETAFMRVRDRDRRKMDDKYNRPLDRTSFESVISGMQNPSQTEDYIVLSGKHTFQTQRSNVVKKLYDMGLLQSQQTTVGIPKPSLVNLVPNTGGGRVDTSRRSINIR